MYTLHFLSNVHPLLDDLKQMQQVLYDPQYRANKSSKQVATCMHANAYVCVKLSALLVPGSAIDSTLPYELPWFLVRMPLLIQHVSEVLGQLLFFISTMYLFLPSSCANL
jgi:hypothetical protein